MNHNRHGVPHFVYRCYDAEGALLYVGCSISPVARVEGHRLNSWWGSEIATVRNLVFPDRETALNKEREAIYLERPRCNVRCRWYRGDDRADWTERDYEDFRLAVVRTANGLIDTPSTARLLRQIDHERTARFAPEMEATA